LEPSTVIERIGQAEEASLPLIEPMVEGMAGYERQYVRVRVRRDLYEKLKASCEGSIVDCVNELLERALASPTESSLMASMLPIDCKAKQLKPFDLFLVECSGGGRAIMPSDRLLYFAQHLRVTLEIEGNLPVLGESGKGGS